MAPLRKLSNSTLRHLTEVDHRDHEALVALDSAAGEAVGVARYVRTDDPEVAEVAIAVVDDWQGLGVGTALLELLVLRAREEGIARFTGVALASNRDILDLIGRLGPARVVRRDGATVEVDVELDLAAPQSGPLPVDERPSAAIV